MDHKGALVGLLTGMDWSASSFRAGFATPTDEIQADAKSETNGILSV